MEKGERDGKTKFNRTEKCLGERYDTGREKGPGKKRRWVRGGPSGNGDTQSKWTRRGKSKQHAIAENRDGG